MPYSLKPCPYCRREAVMVRDYTSPSGNHVQCPTRETLDSALCPVMPRTAILKTQKHAADAWNHYSAMITRIIDRVTADLRAERGLEKN